MIQSLWARARLRQTLGRAKVKLRGDSIIYEQKYFLVRSDNTSKIRCEGGNSTENSYVTQSGEITGKDARAGWEEESWWVKSEMFAIKIITEMKFYITPRSGRSVKGCVVIVRERTRSLEAFRSLRITDVDELLTWKVRSIMIMESSRKWQRVSN